MKKTSQHGIAHLGILLLLVVSAVVAFAGYKVYQNDHPATVANNSQTSTLPVQTIQSKADLNSAEANLNSQNIDNDLNPDQYNQDVNSLL